MRTVLVLALMLGACTFASPTGNPVDAPPNDGKIVDAPPDVPSGPPYCFGHTNSVMGQVCLNALPVGTLTVAGPVNIPINTDVGSAMCNAIAIDPDYCVVAHTSISLANGANVTATGSRPLVLLSTSSIQMGGTIDVASHRTGTQPLGAGGNPMASGACGTPSVPTGATGGAGGSFGLAGGTGGPGDGGTGGIPPGALVPLSLRGGCPGDTGGSTGGGGGNGGGAVALIAATTIDIDGEINASGQGGAGGASGGRGGGGGGSGGMIVIDAGTTITGTGDVFANGGGGAGGSTPGSSGNSGNDSPNPTTAGSGGAQISSAGAGGTGSRASTGGGNGGTGAANNGGGGGGGGAGAIRFYGTSSFMGQRSPT